MRSEGAIRHQLKQALFRHLKRALQQSFKRIPSNCSHNETLDPRSHSLCFFNVGTSDWNARVCDSRLDGDKVAQGCPYWTAKHDSAAIKGEFRELIESGSRAEIAKLFPDVAAMLWVLDTATVEFSPEEEAPEEPPEVQEEESEEVLGDSWGDRFFRWVRNAAVSE